MSILAVWCGLKFLLSESAPGRHLLLYRCTPATVVVSNLLVGPIIF